MNEEDIETIAKLCGLKTKIQKTVLENLLKDLGITDLDADPIDINLDNLPKDVYEKNATTTGKVIDQLMTQGIIRGVFDVAGDIPKEKIASQVEAYFIQRVNVGKTTDDDSAR